MIAVIPFHLLFQTLGFIIFIHLYATVNILFLSNTLVYH